MRPVSAKIPNARVNTTAKTAEGMFNSNESPQRSIVLVNFLIESSSMADSRESEACNHRRLIKGKPCSANGEESPAEKE